MCVLMDTGNSLYECVHTHMHTWCAHGVEGEAWGLGGKEF